MNINNLFTTLSTSGAVRTFHLHPLQNIIAYDAGFHVVLLDLNNEKKVTAHSHNNSISCIQFVGTNYEYILSIDSQSIPCLLLTHWLSLTLIQQHYLTNTVKDSPVLKYQCAYSPQNFLIIAENYKDKYAFSVWDLKSDCISLLASHSEDLLTQCNGINVFEPQQGKHSLFFAISEKKVIKYWGYSRQRLELLHKIHAKDSILDSVISPLTQFLLFITEPGKLCIINKEGQFVSSVAHPMLTYSCLSLYNDYLFLGTAQGDVEIYQLSSLKFAKSLKNLRQLPKKTLTSPTKADYYSKPQQEEQRSIEPSKKLIKLGITASNRVLVLQYEDAQVFFYDFEKGKQIGSITGHSDKIKEIAWHPNEHSMVSCSHDGTLRVWSFLGDRWTSSPIYAGALSGYARINEKAREIMPKGPRGDISFRSHKTSDYKFTCMQVLWEENEIYAGDNRGFICVYDMQNRNLKYEIQVADSKIKKIAIGDNRGFVGIVLADGRAFVVERRENFGLKIQLEEGSGEIGGKTNYFRGIKLFEGELPTTFLKSQEKFKKSNSFSVQKHVGYNPEFQSTNRTQGVSGANEGYRKVGVTQLRAVTTANAGTLRLYQVSRNPDALSSLVIASYNVNGKILDFDVHTSKEYVVVLASQGILSIFKLGSGELKIRVELAKSSQKMVLDQSGLYIGVAMPCMPDNKEMTTFRKSGKWIPPERTFSFTRRENELIERNFTSDQSAVVLYELWTGEPIGEIKKLQTVTAFEFSEEGRYLAIGSRNGQVTVLEVDGAIQANMKGVLDEVRQDPLFWSNFYIDTQQNQNEEIRDYKEPEFEDDRESNYQERSMRDLREDSVSIPSQHLDLAAKLGISEKFREIGTGITTPSQRSIVLTNKEIQVSQRGGMALPDSLRGSYRDDQSSGGRLGNYQREDQVKHVPRSEAMGVERGIQGSQRGSIMSNVGQNNNDRAPQYMSPAFRGSANLSDKKETAAEMRQGQEQKLYADRSAGQSGLYGNYGKNLLRQQPEHSEKGVGSMNINDPYPKREREEQERNVSQQGNVNARKIEADPDDIDDYEESRDYEKEGRYEKNESERFNPVSDYQSRYGYKHLGGNYPWERENVIDNELNQSEEVSNMYHDIDEFQKRFLREPGSNK